MPIAEETKVSSQPEEKEYPSTSSEQIEATTTNPEVIAEEENVAVDLSTMKKDIQGERKDISPQADIVEKDEKMSLKVDSITELKQTSFAEDSENLTIDVQKQSDVENSAKIGANKAKESGDLPVEASKENSSASEDGNEAKSVEDGGNQPTVDEVRAFRPRIKREFLYSEATREPPDSSKEVAEEDSAKPEPMDVTEGEQPIAADSSIDVQQETSTSVKQVKMHISRRQLKRRSSNNQKEESKKASSRSHSSDSNSSPGQQTSRRKSASKSSSSSRSSSAESRKSQTSLHQESDSISSSGTSKKQRKHSPIEYKRSPSPVSKMSESETRDSISTRRNKEGGEIERRRRGTNDNSVSQTGEDNEESLDLETKAEEILETKPSSEKDASNNNSVGIVHVRKISLSSSRDNSNKENVEGTEGDRPARKRKWGSSGSKNIPKTSYTISTDSLKTLIPDVKPSTVATDFSFDITTTPPSDQDENTEVSPPKEVRIVRTVTQVVPGSEEIAMENRDKPKNDTVQYRPLSLMEEPIARPRSPSPARNPVNHIIHIRNLVRPFTLKQLKDLLSKTGTVVESGFWIDKIKSKCYATYETVEQAAETRQALHGTQWPPSNRKNLIVDFADEDELRFHMSLELTTEPPKPPENYPEPPVRDVMRRVREVAAPQISKNRDFGPILPPPPIREWDREKIGERSPGEKERRKRMMSPPREKRRERGRVGIREHKRKEEEEAPAKLLDDLFRKTKVAPCIYWLPLTNEQIKLREDERKQRLVEREKRRQQMKKDEAEKGKPAVARDAKKAKSEEVTHHRKRSPPSSHSRSRKR